MKYRILIFAGILLYGAIYIHRPPRVDEWIAYLITSTALTHPLWLLFDFSLRPLFTLLSALFVKGLPQAGYHAMEGMNLVVSVATLTIVRRIALGRGLTDRFAWLAVFLCAFSFAFIDFAFCLFTEPLLTLALVTAVYFYYGGRYRTSGLAVSALLLCQPMTLPLAPLWILALWRKDRVAAALSLALPAVWFLAGRVVGIDLFTRFFLHTRIPWSEAGTNGYIPYAYHLVVHVYGPLLTLLFVLGLLCPRRISENRLLLANAFYFLILPPTLVTFGEWLHFTGGIEPRYLYPSIPLAAIVAAAAVMDRAPWLWADRPGHGAEAPGGKIGGKALRVGFVLFLILLPFFHPSQTDLVDDDPALAGAVQRGVEAGATLYIPYPNLGLAHQAGAEDLTRLRLYFLRGGVLHVHAYSALGENLQYPLRFRDAPPDALFIWIEGALYDESSRRMLPGQSVPEALLDWTEFYRDPDRGVVFTNEPNFDMLENST